MTFDDFRDLFFLVIWSFVNGLAFGWLTPYTPPYAYQISLVFGLIGWMLGILGIYIRSQTNKFPFIITFFVIILPFTCTYVGVVSRIVLLLDQWLAN